MALRNKRSAGQLIITPQDDQMAADYNIGYIIRALKKASEEKFLKFIDKNEAVVATVMMAAAPHLYKDDKANLTGEDLKRIFIENIQKAEPKIILGLNTKDIVRQKILTTPEIVAQEKQKTDERKAAFRAHRDMNFSNALSDVKKGIGGFVSLATLGTSLRSTPFILLKSVAQLSVLPATKIMSGLLDAGHVSRKSRLLSGLGATVFSATMATIPALDSSDYVSSSSFLNDAFIQACTPDIRELSTSNIAYALNFNANASDHPRESHAYHTMMAAAQHNVPVIALHMIGYFESQKFSDMVSNNSSASSPFQIIDATKALLLHNYGQETSAYLSAKERIADGNSVSGDQSLITAIDAISKTSMDALNKGLEDQKLSGPIHDALVYADLSDIASELIALDIKDKFPEISGKNITAQEIADITIEYYESSHFLGSGNYALLNNMAKDYPNILLTDNKAVTKAYNENTAKKLAHIVKTNPALLKPDMTAQQALDSIKKNFMNYVQDPYQKFSTTYDPSLQVRDLCLTDAAKIEIPNKISYLDTLAYGHGYQGFKGMLTAFSDSLSLETKPVLVAKNTTTPKTLSLSNEIEAAVRSVIEESAYAPKSSLRPKERPHSKELKTSQRPQPRPSGLGEG